MAAEPSQNVVFVLSPVRSILVVDDEAAVRQSLNDVLCFENWDCRLVDSGWAALREIERNPPDVILLDHRLPDFSGCEIVQQLRAKNCDIPVVLLTSNYHVRAVGQWGNSFFALAKPFSIDDLFRVISVAASSRPVSVQTGGS